ncbi:hypothetical protein FDP22_04535 [Paroceanicella profunda]|uniref:Thiamine pyrophosphate-binding protein n=1 Tax=Paroceanicella profunda TaxID=2579971 RepID=A0A5B8FGE8_9RHOB|nr:thiamine pyrophosphate-dependent enzyme [Paroceanicella profunda]QDL91111.1 hypothetical protein FDP22_04535 [Paroceanicella profunda]
MQTYTTGEALVRALIDRGIDTIFGIPGAHMYEFNDALARASNRIRFIHTRHEQGAGYMAYGYAKSTGRPAAFTVVPGPGVLNAGAALCTAYAGNAPVLCITGNIFANLIGQGRGQLHELPDQLATLRSFTRGAWRIDHPAQVPARVEDAFRTLLAPRPGPVALEAPWDVFGQSAAFDMPAPAATPALPAPDPAVLERAAALAARAKRPLIMVGGGAQDAGAEVLALARRLDAPVTAHRSGKGAVPEDDPHFLDAVAAWEYWQECDLLIGIGSRLELQYMRWSWQPEGLKTIRIDTDPTEFVRLPADVGLYADAAAGASVLMPLVPQAARGADLAGLRARARAAIDVVQPQMAWLDAIRAVLPRDGIYVDEISQMGFTARFGLPVYTPRGYISSAYQENLGFGFMTALGVKVAHPDRAVVQVSGDGGFMFGVQEMATAVQYGIGVVTIVFDNASYGNVRRDQVERYGGRLLGADLQNPDFVALAQSFGMAAERVERPEALGPVLSAMLASGAPGLIVVPLARGQEASPWPFVMPKRPG